MSFVDFAPKPLLTREQIATQVHQVSVARGLDELATVIALMAIATEVGANGQWWCPANVKVPSSLTFPHDSESDDNRSMGYFQQQPGPNGEPWWGTAESMMTLPQAADTFLTRLPADYTKAADNPALAGEFAQRVQGSAFPDRYAGKWGEAWTVLRAITLPPVKEPTVPDATVTKPDYNEYAVWSPNHYPTRQGNKASVFLLHTEEPPADAADALTNDNAADQLARNVLANPAEQVSYHYAISQARDGGVTVIDCVDTDQPSWSVGDANNISINLVFAGSRAAWTREQWLKQANAIDVAAYLAVQDCRKYGMSLLVVPPPYSAGKPGISDHNWVTKVFGWGSHTDVGPNFPWDVFSLAVAKYVGDVGEITPAPTPSIKRLPVDYTDRELLEYIAVQLGPGLDVWGEDGDLGHNPAGQRRTLRAGIAALLRKVGA